MSQAMHSNADQATVRPPQSPVRLSVDSAMYPDEYKPIQVVKLPVQIRRHYVKEGLESQIHSLTFQQPLKNGRPSDAPEAHVAISRGDENNTTGVDVWQWQEGTNGFKCWSLIDRYEEKDEERDEERDEEMDEETDEKDNERDEEGEDEGDYED